MKKSTSPKQQTKDWESIAKRLTKENLRLSKQIRQRETLAKKDKIKLSTLEKENKDLKRQVVELKKYIDQLKTEIF